MHTEHKKENSFALLQIFSGEDGFQLFSVAADECGLRISFMEFISGERSGALLGLLWRRCPDCGTEVSMDLFWTGLICG